jgi:hypothetical protein
VTCRKPAGAFYLFPDISKAIAASGLKTSAEFADLLLDEQKVAVTRRGIRRAGVHRISPRPWTICAREAGVSSNS